MKKHFAFSIPQTRYTYCVLIGAGISSEPNAYFAFALLIFQPKRTVGLIYTTKCGLSLHNGE